jgi:hypothetical protein
VQLVAKKLQSSFKTLLIVSIALVAKIFFVKKNLILQSRQEEQSSAIPAFGKFSLSVS